MKSPFPLQGGHDFAASPPQLELLLAYEDRPTAERAMRAVEAVLNKPEVSIQTHLHAWRLDVLGDPELGEQAGNEASVADILVVAMHGKSRLAAQAETRLKQWVNVKPAKPRALVISLDSEAKPQASTNSTLTELRAVAIRNGVTVLLHCGEPARRASGANSADIFGHAPFMGRHPDAFPQPPNPHSHWGLND